MCRKVSWIGYNYEQTAEMGWCSAFVEPVAHDCSGHRKKFLQMTDKMFKYTWQSQSENRTN